MRPYFLSMLALLICGILDCKAQIEPQFKFYLAFEDATGQRDTVWIVIDTNAVLVEDTMFNEWILPIDSHSFDVYFGINYGIGDSSKSVYARQPGGFSTYINAVNFTNPTIVRWDTSLLINHSLNTPYKQIWIRTENDVPGIFHLYDTLFLNQGIGEKLVDSVILNGNLDHFPIQMYLATIPINLVGENIPKNDDGIALFPNPCHDEFKVSSQTWPIDFIIYDLMGRKVSRGTLKREIDTFSVSQLSRGTYIVRLNSHDESWTQRLVVD